MKTLLLSILTSLLSALSQQTLKSDISLSVTAPDSQPITYSGSLLMQGELFRAEMLGITAAYDGSALFIYQPEADELTISHPSAEDLRQTNPLLFVKALVPLCNAAERAAKNNSETVITLSPKNSYASTAPAGGMPASVAQDYSPASLLDGVRTITLRVRNADLMPLSVELRETKTTTLLTFKAPRWLSSPADAAASASANSSAASVSSPFVLSTDDFPSAFINDLR